VDAGEDREYSRQPRPEDLTKICAALNRDRYILIGGFAVIARILPAVLLSAATEATQRDAPISVSSSRNGDL